MSLASTLKEFADKFGCVLHAYVLMTNHVHLLLTPARDDSAALMMKHLGRRAIRGVAGRPSKPADADGRQQALL